MRIRSIKELKDLKGKRALTRVDYNLSFVEGKPDFKDNLRIKASVETIKFLLEKGATVVLLAHLGRPDGWDKKLTLAPIAKYLSRLLKTACPVRGSGSVASNRVNFIADDLTKKDLNKKIKKGVNLLENIRFYDGECKNDRKFAKRLAELGDIYINEGFSVSHRADASVAGLQNFLPSYAGIYLEKEIANLSKLLRNNLRKNNRPFVALMGGAKISTKINLINNLLKSADNILLGGALISNVLKYQGYDVGGTIIEKVPEKVIKNIVKSKKIIFPADVVVGERNDVDTARLTQLYKDKKICNKNEEILDIGPESMLKFSAYIKKAQTIVWNGPMGYFEKLAYGYGTFGLARLIAARGKGRAFAVVGGGETIAALNMTKMEKYVDWVSTGGGAMLSFLAGERMPGLARIVK
ncbi:MAG: phosphoglycerate kinase [bacterium]